MSRAPSPTVRRRRLGVELRRLREAAGLTGEQVTERVGWSASKLSRLENGHTLPGLSDLQDLLDLYEVTGAARDHLVAIARDAGNTRAWRKAYPAITKRQRGYAELEAGCSEIWEYGQLVVPGLLQSQDYARQRILAVRALLDESLLDESLSDQAPPDAAELDAEVAARAARQSLLTRQDPPRYDAVLEETALTRLGGPPDVVAGQLRHLRRLAELPTVTLRVLTRDAASPHWYLPATAFSIYLFADPDDPGTVAVEALGADLLLTEDATLARYRRAFEWLREAALPPEETRRWLATAASR